MRRKKPTSFLPLLFYSERQNLWHAWAVNPAIYRYIFFQESRRRTRVFSQVNTCLRLKRGRRPRRVEAHAGMQSGVQVLSSGERRHKRTLLPPVTILIQHSLFPTCWYLLKKKNPSHINPALCFLDWNAAFATACTLPQFAPCRCNGGHY